MSIELRDARRSAADREWLTNVYPFYLHDLSEFDDTYYTLDDRGIWMPDHRLGWLEEDEDHPLIILESGRRAVFALFDRFRGKWEIFELARNTIAISFWRRVIGEYRGGRYTETSDASGVRQTVDTS